jgi:hypothetical protein
LNLRLSFVRVRPVIQAALLVLAASIAALAAAGVAAAASPVITTTLASDPQGVAIAYSTTAQPTYVKYTASWTRDPIDTNVLTHAALSEPVACSDSTLNCSDTKFFGATITNLSVTVTTGTTTTTVCDLSSATSAATTFRGEAAPSTFTREGFTCNLASLPQGAVVSMAVVFKVPTLADWSALSPLPTANAFAEQAALSVQEGGNDSQPQASHTDTFPAGLTSTGVPTPITTSLTTNTTDALNSYSNPDATTTQTFSTDPTLCAGKSCTGTPNSQSTTAQLKKGVGVGVGLAESAYNGTTVVCPSAALKFSSCIGQLSTILVEGSGASGLFACTATDSTDTNCLQFTIVIAGPSLTVSVNPNKVVVFHTFVFNNVTVTEATPRCSIGTDDSGDCVVSVTQDSKTKNVTIIARGPSNGGWGGGI